MCLVVYIFSEKPLPLLPWQRKAPGFYISELAKPAKGIRRHLTKPYLALAGTHTGCGCGFLQEGVVPGTPEYTDLRSMYRHLAEYLRSASPAQIVEIYACWGGEEGLDPEYRRRVDVKEFESDGFAFRENELLMVEVTS